MTKLYFLSQQASCHGRAEPALWLVRTRTEVQEAVASYSSALPKPAKTWSCSVSINYWNLLDGLSMQRVLFHLCGFLTVRDIVHM